ncbi:hypothetical protein SAMN05428947_103463 [Mucilaginibacter sp. OK283]|jgi:uncharacterized membrane protein|nr:hypothetical protein SAMN05428947_103463 [Mucilaginibacter sp. OK283]
MEAGNSAYKYYKKSRLFYRLAFYTCVWIALYSSLFNGINPIIGAFAILLPVLAVYVLVPMGLFYIIKSYTHKEPFNRFRMYYFAGHLFFLVILIGFAIVIITDISKFTAR